MRKTDIILFHLRAVSEKLKGSDFGHHGLQFKVVDRVSARIEDTLTEEDALINLLNVIYEEIKQAQSESAI